MEEPLHFPQEVEAAASEGSRRYRSQHAVGNQPDELGYLDGVFVKRVPLDTGLKCVEALGLRGGTYVAGMVVFDVGEPIEPLPHGRLDMSRYFPAGEAPYQQAMAFDPIRDDEQYVALQDWLAERGTLAFSDSGVSLVVHDKAAEGEAPRPRGLFQRRTSHWQDRRIAVCEMVAALYDGEQTKAQQVASNG